MAGELRWSERWWGWWGSMVKLKSYDIELLRLFTGADGERLLACQRLASLTPLLLLCVALHRLFIYFFLVFLQSFVRGGYCVSF